MYAQVATNSNPIRMDTPFSQLVTASPLALPTGTRPDAIAPTTVPMKKGVSSEERPKRRSAAFRAVCVRAVRWNANPEPRSTIPSAARLSGMKSVEKIEANASENPVHSTTSTKISQTWFASQTGPMAQSINSRTRRARSPRPAARLQKPPPKSAPPNTV